MRPLADELEAFQIPHRADRNKEICWSQVLCCIHNHTSQTNLKNSLRDQVIDSHRHPFSAIPTSFYLDAEIPAQGRPQNSARSWSARASAVAFPQSQLLDNPRNREILPSSKNSSIHSLSSHKLNAESNPSPHEQVSYPRHTDHHGPFRML